MNKEFCNYTQALDLKKLGFDEPCMAIYYSKDKSFSWHHHKDHTNDESALDSGKFNISAPLYQQAFRWFREKHNLWIEVHVEDNVKLGEQKYYWRIFGEYTSYEENSWIKAKVDSNGVMSNTYEEAELACLNKLIETVKNK